MLDDEKSQEAYADIRQVAGYAPASQQMLDDAEAYSEGLGFLTRCAVAGLTGQPLSAEDQERLDAINAAKAANKAERERKYNTLPHALHRFRAAVAKAITPHWCEVCADE